MPDSTPSRFDEERLSARVSKVTSALAAATEDTEHLRRLATIGTVAGMIAHEMRNLMTPVRSYAQMALRRPGDEAQTRKALEAAMSGADQAVAIAESLLELTGGKPAEPAPFQVDEGAPIGEALRQILLSMDPPLDCRAIVLSETIDQKIRADIGSAELRQVLLNLVLNAVRAMPLGGRLAIAARSESGSDWNLARSLEDDGLARPGCGGGCKCDGDCRNCPVTSFGHTPEPLDGGATWTIAGTYSGGGDRVVIEVTDSGGGIPAELVGRIFDPFVSGAGGRGLGLATCRAMVERAGGRIGVVSAEGVGTRFVLELGLAGAARAAA